MPSQTPLHESYSTTVREPLSQGDFFEGLAQLATTGVVEATDIVASIHREIMLRPLGMLDDDHISSWNSGITGRIYNTIRHIMLLVGHNAAHIFRLYNKSLTPSKRYHPLPDLLKILVNALNGVMGDHLINQGNPLAIPMVLYDRYGQPQRGELSGRIVILTHGLCMSYLSWHPGESDGLGEHILYSQPDATVMYLDYNTGRRISLNGRAYARLLQDLIDKNPKITQIDLLGHSMGGLVSRSALFYGKQEGHNWLRLVENLVCIGSPHNGAILERLGFYVQDILSKMPFAGSLAKLGDIRSAGIIDLRHGSIRDDDWEHMQGRNGLPEDYRRPAPLPSHINAYLIAGSMDDNDKQSKARQLIGDGLVTIESALGEHESEHALNVPEGNKAVFYGVNHMSLQYNERVHRQISVWLSDVNRGTYVLNPRILSFPEEGYEEAI